MVMNSIQVLVLSLAASQDFPEYIRGKAADGGKRWRVFNYIQGEKRRAWTMTKY
jgi:hypothetical protein